MGVCRGSFQPQLGSISGQPDRTKGGSSQKGQLQQNTLKSQVGFRSLGQQNSGLGVVGKLTSMCRLEHDAPQKRNPHRAPLLLSVHCRATGFDSFWTIVDTEVSKSVLCSLENLLQRIHNPATVLTLSSHVIEWIIIHCLKNMPRFDEIGMVRPGSEHAMRFERIFRHELGNLPQQPQAQQRRW